MSRIQHPSQIFRGYVYAMVVVGEYADMTAVKGMYTDIVVVAGTH